MTTNNYVWEKDISLNDLVLKQKEEIERLNNGVKQLEKSIMISNKKHSFMTKDNIKLRTIINELDKWLEEQLMYFNDNNKEGGFSTNVEDLEIVKEKLQELKGSN